MSDKEKIEALQALRNKTQVSDLKGTLRGLCGEINVLYRDRQITSGQCDFLEDILRESTGGNSWAYVWPARKLRPRIKWIDKQIKLLRNGSKL